MANYDSIKDKGFDKNPQNINKSGPPRKLFSTVNLELKAKWIIPLSKEQLIEAYWLIFNTEEEELTRIAKNTSYPYALRLIILEMSNKQTRSKAMSDYRDYMFWKALQTTDNNNANVDVTDNLSEEQRKKIANRFK